MTTVRRRYVAVPAGTYAAPVRPVRVPTTAVASPPAAFAEPSAAAAAEPDLDALLSGPASPAFAPLAEERVARPFGATAGLERLAGHDERASEWAPHAARRMMLGGLAGACAGAVVAIVVLALSSPEGFVAALLNPVSLWRSVDDTRLKLTAVLVIVGSAFIGSAIPALTRAQRSWPR